MKNFTKILAGFGVAAVLFVVAPVAHAAEWYDIADPVYYDDYAGSWVDFGSGCANCGEWYDIADPMYDTGTWYDIADPIYYDTGEWYDIADPVYYETYTPTYTESYTPGYYETTTSVAEELAYYNSYYYGGSTGGGYSYGYTTPSYTYSQPVYHNVSRPGSTNISSVTNTNTIIDNSIVDNSVYMNNVGNTNIVNQSQPYVPYVITQPTYVQPSCSLSLINTGYGYATLSWTTANASSAIINNGVGSVSVVSGSRNVPAYSATSYTMTVYNSQGGSATCYTAQNYAYVANPTVTVSSYIPVSYVPYTGIDSWGYVLGLIALALGCATGFFFYRAELADIYNQIFAKSEDVHNDEEVVVADTEEEKEATGDSLVLERGAAGPKLSFSRV